MVNSLAKLKFAIAKDACKSSLFRSSIGKPIIKFILNRKFDRYARLLAYDFAANFYEISGVDIADAQVSDGCIAIDLRLESNLDFLGRDIRSQMISSDEYRELFAQFDVQSIYFHCFPNSSNSDHKWLIGPTGRPYRAD